METENERDEDSFILILQEHEKTMKVLLEKHTQHFAREAARLQEEVLRLKEEQSHLITSILELREECSKLQDQQYRLVTERQKEIEIRTSVLNTVTIADKQSREALSTAKDALHLVNSTYKLTEMMYHRLPEEVKC